VYRTGFAWFFTPTCAQAHTTDKEHVMFAITVVTTKGRATRQVRTWNEVIALGESAKNKAANTKVRSVKFVILKEGDPRAFYLAYGRKGTKSPWVCIQNEMR
jgi:hypothetical protein